MIQTRHIVAALLTTCVSVAFAQTAGSPTTPAATPTKSQTQGDASIDKNLAKKPDSKGLLNADQHVQANEAKAAEKRAAADTKADAKLAAAKKKAKAEKSEARDAVEGAKAEKLEKIERPAKPEHPSR